MITKHILHVAWYYVLYSKVSMVEQTRCGGITNDCHFIHVNDQDEDEDDQAHIRIFSVQSSH